MGEEVVGSVASLWRYPVKSMLGEQDARVRIDRRGVIGDRRFAVRDQAGKFGSGKNTRRFRRMEGLFGFRARMEGALPVIEFPDGTCRRADDPALHEALSSQLGAPVTLAIEEELSHFDSAALHLLSTGSLRALREGTARSELDARRFRPNLVVETNGEPFAEEGWLGRELAVGDEARIRITTRTERCVMIGFGQAELPEDPTLLRAVSQLRAPCVGVYAEVLTPGELRVGDPLRLL